MLNNRIRIIIKIGGSSEFKVECKEIIEEFLD